MMKSISIISFVILLLSTVSLFNVVVESNSFPTFPYDQTQAEFYLNYAYAAYCDGPDLQRWNCTTCQGLPNFNIISSIFNITTNTQAYVGYTQDQIIVSFRGSMDVQSWITNFKFLETVYPPYPQAKVHDGFYNAWMSVRSQVKVAIDSAFSKCGSECKQLWIIGHSLGGAIATLSAADVQGWYQTPVYTYTFGSPRVGDSFFVEYYNKVQPNTYRVVNQKDIVPHVAPEGLLGYHHVPTEVWYPTNTTYIQCNDSGEDPTCSDSVVGLSIYDHLHYLDIHCCCREAYNSDII